jgi:dienelactone hydrolase
MFSNLPTKEGAMSPRVIGLVLLLGACGAPLQASDESAATAKVPAPAYDSEGPVPYVVYPASVDGKFLVAVYQPTSSGAHPVVLLAAGFLQTASAYAPYARRLASYGITAVLRDDPGLLADAAGVASDLAYVVTTWLPAENGRLFSPLARHVDLAHVGLAGHSKGGQAALLAAEVLPGRVRAALALDPVDSGGSARGGLGALGIATAFLGETTDATGGILGVPCAPAADNYQVLFGDAASPSVAITIVGADHGQFEDPLFCAFCGLCTAGSSSAGAVLGLARRYATAFFARELLGDASVGATFAGVGAATDEAAGAIQLTAK